MIGTFSNELKNGISRQFLDCSLGSVETNEDEEDSINQINDSKCSQAYLIDSPALTRGFHFSEDLKFGLERASDGRFAGPLSSRLLKLASMNPIFQETDKETNSVKDSPTFIDGAHEMSHGGACIAELLSRRKVSASDANNVSNDLDFFGQEEYSSQNSSIIMFEFEMADDAQQRRSSKALQQPSDKSKYIEDHCDLKPEKLHSAKVVASQE